MDFSLILTGKATLEDLYILNRFGYEFTIEDGKVTEINERSNWEMKAC